MNQKAIVVLGLILLVLFSGCIQEPEQKENNGFKEVPYSGQLEGKYVEIYYSKGHGHSGWFQEITFLNDGNVIYKEEKWSNKDSNLILKDKIIERTELENLAFQIQQLGFFELENSYNCMEDPSLDPNCAYDSYDIEFTVTIADKTKKIEEYDYSGPELLRHIEKLINAHKP